MRDRRRAEVEGVGELADAGLAAVVAGDQRQQTQPLRIPEGLEQRGQVDRVGMRERLTRERCAATLGEHPQIAVRRGAGQAPPGYANFAIAEPPLKLVLLEDGQADESTVMDHLGIEVTSTDEVDGATQRLKDAGLATFTETDTDCC